MILIYGKIPGSFEICPEKVGIFLSSCREVKSARSGNTEAEARSKQGKTANAHPHRGCKSPRD